MLLKNIQTETEFLKLISGETELLLEALSAKNIADDRTVFKSGQNAFKMWNVDSTRSKPTAVSVFETTQEATASQLFKSFNCDLDALCLTQHQIMRFSQKFPDWIVYDNATLFLIQGCKDEEYFVVHIVKYDTNEMCVCLSRFNASDVWNVKTRLVVPLSAL